ncbi:hypothetical protein [Sorangium sp. So ce363]|uniref:hypothetical protein n=1 Tax=Sorangium sp. So ce363 TaxID=3133304 RepID=UPI003F5DCDA6
MSAVSRELVLAPRADQPFGPELFELRSAPIPRPRQGEVLVRNPIMSCDHTQVAWLFGGCSCAPRIAAGQVMRAWCAGHVVESRHPRFRPGDRVWGTLGWQDYALSDGEGILPLRKVPDDIPLGCRLGVAGINGVTAHLGLVETAAMRENDTVVVSTAAGATGSAAVQIARILGAHVVAIAGGPEKCRWLEEELRVADTIDYRNEDVAARLPAATLRGQEHRQAAGAARRRGVDDRGNPRGFGEVHR